VAVLTADASLAFVVNTREAAGGACAERPTLQALIARARPSPATAKDRPFPVAAWFAAAMEREMDLFSPEFLSALAAIIVIDLVLAGDNAIVIALAARNVPKHLQKKAIMWGTAGAIIVRTSMTVVVVWLLKIPGLLLAGGLLLVWIAYKLLAPADNDSGHEITPAASFWGAMKTIIVADAVMGLDNVLAVAGAAQGSFLLVVLGLLISIPIVIWGSTLILKWVERFPVIIYLGAAVLAWTSAKMMLGEPLIKDWLERNTFVAPLVYLVVMGGVLGGGWLRSRAAKQREQAV
jgi:YjbE family integral membrane protein